MRKINPKKRIKKVQTKVTYLMEILINKITMTKTKNSHTTTKKIHFTIFLITRKTRLNKLSACFIIRIVKMQIKIEISAIQSNK